MFSFVCVGDQPTTSNLALVVCIAVLLPVVGVAAAAVSVAKIIRYFRMRKLTQNACYGIDNPCRSAATTSYGSQFNTLSTTTEDYDYISTLDTSVEAVSDNTNSQIVYSSIFHSATGDRSECAVETDECSSQCSSPQNNSSEFNSSQYNASAGCRNGGETDPANAYDVEVRPNDRSSSLQASETRPDAFMFYI